MSVTQLNIDFDYFNGECEFSDLKEAVEKLCTASESQFAQISNEKWFVRLFDTVTFSKKNEKRLSTSITNLAQAQQVLIELLTRLSYRDTRITGLVEQSFDKITELSSSSRNIATAIKTLRDRCILGLDKSGDIGDLSNTNKEILAGVLLFISEQFNELSEAQQKYTNSVLRYIEIIDPQHINLATVLKEVTDNTVKRKMLMCTMEFAFLHNLNFDFMQNFSGIIDEFDFGKKTIKDIEESIRKYYRLRGLEGFYAKYMDYEEIPIDTFTLDLECEDVDEETSQFITVEFENIPDDEEKTFLNMVVLFTNRYEVNNAILLFKNCVIKIDSKFDTIVKINGGSCTFDNCEFISENIIKNTVFEVWDTAMSFVNCEFFDWSCGMFAKTSSGSLSLLQCTFTCCSGQIFAIFGSATGNNTTINECTFSSHDGNLAMIYSMEDAKAVEINDCIFEDCFSEESIIDGKLGSLIVNRAKVNCCGLNIATAREVEHNKNVFRKCDGDWNTLMVRKISFNHCDILDHAGHIGVAELDFTANFDLLVGETKICFNSCHVDSFNGTIFCNECKLKNCIFENCVSEGDGIPIESSATFIKSDNLFGSFKSFGSFVDTVTDFGSLIDIRPKKEDESHSFIENCKFYNCECDGALIAVIAPQKKNRKKSPSSFTSCALYVSDCEIEECRCSEGYFVGAHATMSGDLAWANDLIHISHNDIDIYNQDNTDKLENFLKSALNKNVTTLCSRIHTRDMSYEVRENIQKKLPDRDYSEILYMVDNSIREKGTAGLAFTDKAIYFLLSQPFDPVYRLPYEKIVAIDHMEWGTVKKSAPHDVEFHLILSNQRTITINETSLNKMSMENILLGIKEIYTGKSSEN